MTRRLAASAAALLAAGLAAAVTRRLADRPVPYRLTAEAERALAAPPPSRRAPLPAGSPFHPASRRQFCLCGAMAGPSGLCRECKTRLLAAAFSGAPFPAQPDNRPPSHDPAFEDFARAHEEDGPS